MKDKRLLCYKVAVVLLYGHVPGVERVTPDQLVVDTAALATHLGLTSHRLRAYLGDLEALGVLSSLSLGHGWARVEVAPPEGWSPTPTTIDVEARTV